MCPFCDIARGRTRAHVVLEDLDTVAFLDHRPLFPGHCLVIPRHHHVTLGDVPSDLLDPIFRTVQLLGRAVEGAVGAHGTFIALNNRVSQSVPHLHVHVVPRRRKDGLRGFFWPRRSYDDEAHMARVAEDVRSAIGHVRATGP